MPSEPSQPDETSVDAGGEPIALDYRGVATGSEIARSGRRLVTPPRLALLPRRCVKTNRTDNLATISTSFSVRPGWFRALAIVAWIAALAAVFLLPRLGVRVEPLPVAIGLAVALFLLGQRVQRSAALMFHLDRSVQARRRAARVLVTGGMIAAGAALLANVFWRGSLLPWQALFSLIIGYFALALADKFVSPLRLKRVTGTRAEYAGAGRAFLDALPAAARQ